MKRWCEEFFFKKPQKGIVLKCTLVLFCEDTVILNEHSSAGTLNRNDTARQPAMNAMLWSRLARGGGQAEQQSKSS